MKKFTWNLIFPLFLITANTCVAQSVFQKTYGGLNSIGYSMEVDNSNFVIAGTTSISGQGGQDVFIMKTNNDGIILWAKTIGGAKDDIAYSIKKTSDNGFIIVGSTASYVSGPTDNSNVYIIKLDLSGNVEWTRSIGGMDTDVAKDVIETYDYKFAVVGNTKSIGAGNEDVYLMELDSVGNLLWDEAIGGTGSDFGNGLIQFSTVEDIIVVGSTTGFSAGGEIPYLIKVSELGVLLNSYTYDLATSVSTKKRYFTKIERAWSPFFSCVITGSDGLGAIGDAQHFIVNISSGSLGINWMKKYYMNSGAGEGTSIQRSAGGGYIIGGTMGIDYPALIKVDFAGNVLQTKFYPDLATSANGKGYSVKQLNSNQFIFTGMRYTSTDTALYLIKTDSTYLSSGCQEQDGFFTGPGASATMSPIANSQTSLTVTAASSVVIDSGVVAIANPVVTTICINFSGIDDYAFESDVIQLNQSEIAIDFILNDKTDEIKSIDLYSVLGSKVKVALENNQTISTSGLSKGVYFYQVSTTKKIPYTGKFIVK